MASLCSHCSQSGWLGTIFTPGASVGAPEKLLSCYNFSTVVDDVDQIYGRY